MNILSSRISKSLLTSAVLLGIPALTYAHCPLCTAGAGALAVLAATLGVKTMIVGLLIGAFAFALGMWVSKIVKREYIPYQKQILTFIIFLSTVLPIMPLVRHFGPLYVSLFGPYGTLLHTTYTIDLYLAGVIIGALIVFMAPTISRKITELRGETISYQGLSITLGLLILASLIIQLV